MANKNHFVVKRGPLRFAIYVNVSPKRTVYAKFIGSKQDHGLPRMLVNFAAGTGAKAIAHPNDGFDIEKGINLAVDRCLTATIKNTFHRLMQHQVQATKLANEYLKDTQLVMTATIETKEKTAEGAPSETPPAVQ